MISDEEARKSLVKLVEHVASHQGKPIPSIPYQDLAVQIGRLDKHGRGHAHGMGGTVLKKMGHLLKGLEVGWGERIPHIQCLVGDKNDPKRLPDEGIRAFWPEYDKLTEVEKEVRVNLEKERVAQYGSRWNNVLDYLKLGSVKLPANLERVFGAGGESPAHKALKEYVRDHPSLVGVNGRAETFTEFALPSLDAIDVMFKESDRWTGVEVKSAVSDGVAGDYERGIYQTVKYSAILNAMRRDRRYGVPQTVRVFLVLEASMPPSLKAVVAALEIELLENVKPTDGKLSS